MGANSTIRRAIKQVSNRALGNGGYAWLQAGAKAWDIRTGTFTEPELDLIRFCVRPGETVIDIGANYGLYTHPLSKAVGASGKVLALEPIPFTVDALAKIAKLLAWRNVELLPKACGEAAGEITFSVPLQESGAISAGQAHFSQRNDDRAGKEQHAPFPKSTEVTCEVVALDDLDIPGDVSLIKSDIEGAELFAFRGATKLIDRHHPTVIAEINPWFLEGFGLELDDLLRFFTEREYSLYRYDPDTSRLRSQNLNEIEEDNYVFVHPARRDRLAEITDSAN